MCVCLRSAEAAAAGLREIARLVGVLRRAAETAVVTIAVRLLPRLPVIDVAAEVVVAMVAVAAVIIAVARLIVVAFVVDMAALLVFGAVLAAISSSS